MKDSPRKIRHKEDLPHNECDREFERKRRTIVCNSADVEDLTHNSDRLGQEGWGGLGLGGLRSGGGWGREDGVSGVGVGGVEVGGVRSGD